MNWLAFAIVAWISLGLEVGLRNALRLGETSWAPSFVVPLAVYVLLSTPARTATWAALLLGVAIDLLWQPSRDGVAAIHLVGPHALGMVVAAQLVLAARGIVIRNAVSLGVLSIAAAAVSSIVVVAVLTVRSILIEPMDFSATAQLRSGLVSALLTGGLALGLGFVYRTIEPLMGFNLDRYGRQIR